MTKNVYIVQKYVENAWRNLHCYSSEKKAKTFISEMAYSGELNYRIFTMQVY